MLNESKLITILERVPVNANANMKKETPGR
jgi:hypothetical protein